MPKCEEFQAMCAVAVDGMLSAEENEALKEHVCACPACRAYLADLVAMRDLWRQEQDELPPANLHEVIMQAVQQEQSVIVQKPTRITRPRFVAMISVAACLVLVISGALGTILGKQVLYPSADSASTTSASTSTTTTTTTESVTSEAAISGEMAMDQPVAEIPESAQEALPRVVTEQVPTAYELPEELATMSFAYAFEVQGQGELPTLENMTLITQTAQASFYAVQNNTAVQEKLVETWTAAGYSVMSNEVLAMPYVREATNTLWIVPVMTTVTIE